MHMLDREPVLTLQLRFVLMELAVLTQTAVFEFLLVLVRSVEESLMAMLLVLTAQEVLLKLLAKLRWQ